MYRLAFALAVAPALAVFCGCGSHLGVDENSPEQTIPGEQGPPGPQGRQGAQGERGPQGEPGIAANPGVLSWGRFSYKGDAVLSEGGPVRVLSFSRLSEGVYEVVYDLRTFEVDNPVVLATGFGVEVPSLTGTPTNSTSIIATSQQFDRSNLTITIIAAVSLVDLEAGGYRLLASDTPFTLVLFGELG